MVDRRGARSRAVAVVFGLVVAPPGCFSEPESLGEDGPGASGRECEPIEMPVDVPDCPEVCNGGCEEGECLIECRDDAPCQDQSIACPSELMCDLDCSGEGVCEGTVLTCPSDFPCSMTCEGAGACLGAEMACGFSECAIECGADESACAATEVRCADGPCIAECASNVTPTLDGCEEACSCSEC